MSDAPAKTFQNAEAYERVYGAVEPRIHEGGRDDEVSFGSIAPRQSTGGITSRSALCGKRLIIALPRNVAMGQLMPSAKSHLWFFDDKKKPPREKEKHRPATVSPKSGVLIGGCNEAVFSRSII